MHRFLRFCALLGVAACAPTVIKIRPTTIVVGNTPEGNACTRQCMQVVSSCIPGCHVEVSVFRRAAGIAAVQQCMDSCADQRDTCLKTCPGALDSRSTTAAAP